MEKKCVIVASGPSAKDFVPPEDVTVIAVNGAIDWIERADYFFTLDLSEVNLKRLRNRRPDTIYCLAFPLMEVPEDLRYNEDIRLFNRNSNPYTEAELRQYKFGPYNDLYWFHRLGCVRGLSKDPTSINTGNSAYGALGLAYHLGFTDVALVGVDATNEPRVEGGTSNELAHLPMLFSSATHQINVVSCGKLDSIPQMEFEEWIKR